MTVSQLRKEISGLKEAAVKLPNFWLGENEEFKVREEMKKELGELKAKIQYYIDAGVFGDNEDNSVNMDFYINCVDTLSIDLIQRWKNRHNLILNEGMQLYRDIGFFN